MQLLLGRAMIYKQPFWVVASLIVVFVLVVVGLVRRVQQRQDGKINWKPRVRGSKNRGPLWYGD